LAHKGGLQFIKLLNILSLGAERSEQIYALGLLMSRKEWL